MQTCNSCNSEYDENNVNIPNPIPDFMCADCGTQLTLEQINLIVSEKNFSANTAPQI